MKITVFFTDSYSIHSWNDELIFRYDAFDHVIKDFLHVTRNGDIIFSNSLNIKRWTVKNYYKNVVKGEHISVAGIALLLSSLRRIYYYNLPLQWWSTCNFIYSELQKINTFERWSNCGIWISHYYGLGTSKHQIW